MRKYLFLFMIIVPILTFSQRSKIDGGILTGIKGSSLNGSGILSNFTKPGISYGVFSRFEFRDKNVLQLEFRYLPKGTNSVEGNVNLKYIEVPLVAKIVQKKNWKYLEIGVAWGYLWKMSKFSNSEWNVKKYIPYYKTEISIILGYDWIIGYKKRDNWIFNLRYEFSLLPVCRYNWGLPVNKSLLNFSKMGQFHRVVLLSVCYIIPRN